MIHTWIQYYHTYIIFRIIEQTHRHARPHYLAHTIDTYASAAVHEAGGPIAHGVQHLL